MGGKNSIAYLSLLVIYVCLKGGKNLTLKTGAQDFCARSITKLYAKSGARAQSHSLTFLKLGRYAITLSIISITEPNYDQNDYHIKLKLVIVYQKLGSLVEWFKKVD